MAAAVYVSNIVINSGTSFSQDFFLEDVSTNSSMDLTDGLVVSQMRKWSGSVGVTTFSCSIIDALAGQVRIELTSDITTSLKPGRYVYDVVIKDTVTNFSARVIEGMALVREGVTRNV